ncbi:MAG: hypothetical protein ACU836_17865 [Gammaproteobacteria bacterium]
MEFPDWAPARLVEFYLDRVNKSKVDVHSLNTFGVDINNLNPESAALCLRFLTNPKMKSVWKILKKSNPELPETLIFNLAQIGIYQANKRQLSRSEEILKYQEIAKAARNLAAKLKNSDLDNPVFYLFDEEAVMELLEHDIKPDKAEGYYCSIRGDKKGVIFKKRGNISYRHNRDNLEFFRENAITPQYPSIATSMLNLAIEAEKLSKIKASEPRLFDGKSHKKTVFIRTIFFDWKTFNKSPLYRTLATFTSVALEEEVIESDVKDAIRIFRLPDKRVKKCCFFREQTYPTIS